MQKEPCYFCGSMEHYQSPEWGRGPLCLDYSEKKIHVMFGGNWAPPQILPCPRLTRTKYPTGGSSKG